MLSSGASQLQRSWQTPFVASCAQVDWKLTRGKWRPKLLDYAKCHSETTVRAATSAAFDIISSTQSAQADLKAAMGSLDGVEGGLASAQLCVYLQSPEECAHCKIHKGGSL